MRITFLFSIFLLAALTMGCASPQWQKASVGTDEQQAGQFEVDSNQCDLQARDEYPIDKDGQRRVYELCMEKKGWSKRDATRSVNFR